jgi:hypothetical protein
MTKSFLLAVIFVSSIVLSWSATFSEGSELLQHSTKRVVGYLDDSILAKRWAIMRDETHPEAPHTLVPVGYVPTVTRIQTGIKPSNSDSQQNVIHAGDVLTLLDDSPTLHLQLAAVAMESAAQGGRLRVRLVRGGAVLSGIVLSAHRVKLQSLAQRFSRFQGSMR